MQPPPPPPQQVYRKPSIPKERQQLWTFFPSNYARSTDAYSRMDQTKKERERRWRIIIWKICRKVFETLKANETTTGKWEERALYPSNIPTTPQTDIKANLKQQIIKQGCDKNASVESSSDSSTGSGESNNSLSRTTYLVQEKRKQRD